MLTDDLYWNEYWSDFTLPAEITPGQSLLVREITRLFDRYLPRKPGLRALEIGGAPGQYLAYLHRTFGYDVTVLDRSATGCEKARENFRLLGINGAVEHGDLFDDEADLGRFDVVYSLGLIEHFTDPLPVVTAHLRLLEPGGTLVLSCPNFLGINGSLVRRLSPALLDTLDVDTMRLESWRRFERDLGLEVLFRGHIGGFEPGLFWRLEGTRRTNRVLSLSLKALRRITDLRLARPLRRLNSPRWSPYLFGVYRLPATSEP
jgi:2-polyprenyl-3-methyl-5-hydroxy-6-metoxy-1,4-benzoquinol methylase